MWGQSTAGEQKSRWDSISDARRQFDLGQPVENRPEVQRANEGRESPVDGASSVDRVVHTPQLTNETGVGEGGIGGEVMERVIVRPCAVGQAVFMSVSRSSGHNLLFCQNRCIADNGTVAVL